MWSAKGLKMSLVAVCVSLIASCTETPDVKLSGLASLMRPPLELSVSCVEIVKGEALEGSAGEEGRIDSLMTPSPVVIVEQWARDRFRAKGNDARAVLTIEDASIKEQSVPSKLGVFQSPFIKYTGVFSVKFEIVGPDGRSHGYAQAAASASRVVSESLTVVEREKVWLCLTETALNQLDEMLEAKIREYLSRFL